MIVVRSSLRGIGLAALISVMMLQAGFVRADDAPPPQAQPAPAPDRRTRGRGTTAPPARRIHPHPPSNTGCRRIRPPSRRSNCPAAHRLSQPPPARSGCSTTRASRRPTSPTPPISSTAPTARRVRSPSCSMAGPVRPPPGCSSARPGRGGCRSMRDARVAVSVARAEAQCRDLARLHRSRLHRSASAPATAASSRAARTCASASSRSTATSIRRVGDPPLAGEARPADLAEICLRRKLWRHSRAEGRAQSADAAGRRRQGTDPDVAAAGFPRVYRHEPPAIRREPAELCRGGASDEGAGHARRSRRRRRLCRAANSFSTSSRARRIPRRPTASADKVAELTGIDQAVSRRLAGRFEVGEFRREFDRKRVR